MEFAQTLPRTDTRLYNDNGQAARRNERRNSRTHCSTANDDNRFQHRGYRFDTRGSEPGHVSRVHMEKPQWTQLASHIVVDTPHFRLRRDVVQLPSGVIIDDYHVRTSLGFCMIFALDAENNVVLVREYRYGNDSYR